MTAKIFICSGCLSAAAAVIMGAFGAHGLRAIIPESLTAVYQTAFRFHMLHSLGMIVVALIMLQVKKSVMIEIAGWMMLHPDYLRSASKVSSDVPYLFLSLLALLLIHTSARHVFEHFLYLAADHGEQRGNRQPVGAGALAHAAGNAR